MYSLSVDGRDALQNLHHIALLSLTREDSPIFSDKIRRTAHDLADRCLKTLTPLALLGDKNEPNRNPVIAKEWASKMKPLEDIFASCVELKVRLPLSRQYFELYLPTLGTRLKSATMEVDPHRAPSKIYQVAKCYFRQVQL